MHRLLFILFVFFMSPVFAATCPTGMVAVEYDTFVTATAGVCPTGYVEHEVTSLCDSDSGNMCWLADAETISCEPGYFFDADTQGCLRCTGGYYCPGGTYVVGDADAGKTICPAGTYADTGASECTKCPAGTYSTATGATSSSTCTACTTTPCNPATGEYLAGCESTNVTTVCVKLPTTMDDVFMDRGEYTDNTWRFVYYKDYNRKFPHYYSGTSAEIVTDGYETFLYCHMTYPFQATIKAVYLADGVPLNTTNPYEGCANYVYMATIKELSGVSVLPDEQCPSGFYTMPYDVSCGVGMVDRADFPNCADDTSGDFCFMPKTICPAGQYLNADTNSCETCPAGTYSDTENAAECTLCPAGTYSSVTGAASESVCTACPAGTSSSVTGAAAESTCVACSSGTYATGGATQCKTCTTTPCDPKTGESTGTCESVDDVIKCARLPTCFGYCYNEDTGTYTTYTNQIASSDDVSWSYYRDGIPYSGTSVKDKWSGAGRYATCTITSPFSANAYGGLLIADTAAEVCANPGEWVMGDHDVQITKLSGDACPDGFFTVPYEETCGTGMVNTADVPNCADDTSGDFCLMPTETVCPVGQYLNADTNSCETCPAGTYSDSEGAFACTACPAGTYSGVGATSCTTCPAGTYSTATGASKCETCLVAPCDSITGGYTGTGTLTCEPGQYKETIENPYSGDIQYVCEYCPAGTYSDDGTRCVECPAGTYSGAVGARACQSCMSGRYSTVTGATSDSVCTVCPAGTYSDAMGASKCETCLVTPCDSITGGYTGTGTLTCEPGQSKKTIVHPYSGDIQYVCEYCPAGTYSNDGTRCVKCPTGMYSETVGAISEATCVACPAGTISSSGASKCAVCPAGTYSDDGSRCVECPAGTYSETVGATSEATCVACPAGTVSSSGASKCAVCPAGTYFESSQSTCEKCPAGTYCPDEDMATPLACPAGTYSETVGATSEATCVACPTGTASSSGASKCAVCPAGTYSDTTGATECKTCATAPCDPTTGASTAVANAVKCARLPSTVDRFYIDSGDGGYDDAGWWLEHYDGYTLSGTAEQESFDGMSYVMKCNITSPFVGTFRCEDLPRFAYNEPNVICGGYTWDCMTISSENIHTKDDDVCPDGFFTISYGGDDSIPNCADDTSGNIVW